MIYPKIPRKSLALLLLCLIFTLAAVGIMFIIYFFNTNNSLFVRPLLKKIYSEGEYHHHQQQLQQQQLQQKQHQIDQHADQHLKEQQHHQSMSPRYYKEIEGSFYEPFSDFEMQRKQLKYSVKDKKYYRNTYQQQQQQQHQQQRESIGSSDEFSDTIYIDDYDRYNEKIESTNNNRNSQDSATEGGDDDLLDINGIEYFETIILDHSPKKNNGIIRGIGKSQSHTVLQDGILNKEKDLLTFTKGLNQRRNRLNRNKGKTIKNIDINKGKFNTGNDDSFDNEAIGSGSGDFIDDTEADDEKDVQQQQQQQHLIQLQRHGERNKKHFKTNKRNGLRKQKIRTFDTEKNENLYSVSSEIISNLSNGSTHKPSSSSSTPQYFGGFVTSTTSIISSMPSSSLQTASSSSLLSSQTSSISSAESRTNRINKLDKKSPPLSLLSSSSSPLSSLSGSLSSKKWMPPSVVSSHEVVVTSIAANHSPESPKAIEEHQNGAWLETRARRIMGNVKKSEERSRQLLLCEEAGGGELCRMLFKGHLTE